MNSSQSSTASIVFTLDASANRRIATFTGAIGDRELLAAFEVMLADPDYDSSRDDLVDLSAVTHMGVTGAGLHRLVELYDEREVPGHHTRSAIVAPTDVLYGVSRMFQALRGEATFDVLEVFRSRDDALLWLNRGRVSGTHDTAESARQ